jgi:MEMO1 family protein
MSFAAELAKAAVENFVLNGTRLDLPADIPADMQTPAAAFVSLKVGGMLRGCIGTIEPTQPTVAEEIIRSAILAASEDPRFMPVEPDELPDLVYSVDVLDEPVPIGGTDELDPTVYGCVVECGNRRGLLLPDLEGVDTAAEQISICRQKAGIQPEEPIDLYRFKVIRHN